MKKDNQTDVEKQPDVVHNFGAEFNKRIVRRDKILQIQISEKEQLESD